MDVAKDNEVEGIISTAALTGRGSGIFYPTAQFGVNAGGVLNVLETSRILDLGRVVFTSSAYIFWDKVELLEETEPINPKSLNTIYSVAKYSGEMLMHAYHNIYGMDTVTCRLHNAYGIAEINPKGIGSLLWKVMKGENVVESTGADNEGDYSYSRDIADGIHILYNTKKISDPRVYNLSDGKIRKLGDIADVINEMGPGNVELGPGKGGKYPGSSPLICDISRAEDLGYRPRPIEESLDEYAKWIKNELKK
jgi:nucleoside-diphosphate-sugar epimerase